MGRILRVIGRTLLRLVPARYSSSRDRLTPEADQLAITQQMRAGF